MTANDTGVPSNARAIRPTREQMTDVALMAIRLRNGRDANRWTSALRQKERESQASDDETLLIVESCATKSVSAQTASAPLAAQSHTR